MQPHDDIRLRHMLDSAEEAVEFAAGKSRKDFDDDRKLLLQKGSCRRYTMALQYFIAGAADAHQVEAFGGAGGGGAARARTWLTTSSTAGGCSTSKR